MNKKLFFLIGVFVILLIAIVVGLFTQKNITEHPVGNTVSETQDQAESMDSNSNRVGIQISEEGLSSNDISVTVLEDEPNASLVIANNSSEPATISLIDSQSNVDVYDSIVIRPHEHIELYINYSSTFLLTYSEKNQSTTINISNQ